LLGWDDQVDISPTETIERVIRNATGLETHTSELIAPRQRRSLLLEHADRLPALQARVADRYRLFLRDATLQETRDRHPTRVRLTTNPASSDSLGGLVKHTPCHEHGSEYKQRAGENPASQARVSHDICD
jgi:hypothetical protein